MECSPTLNNNIALKASTARHRKAFNKAARTSWKQKTESLNLDKDGQKLWKLTKAMNDEDTKQVPIVIERGQEMVTGRRAANCFIETYEEVSSIQVPDERKREIHKEIKEHQVQPNPLDYMNIPFNDRELEDALKALKDKKSPGPDKITNEMLKHMGPKAKSKLIGLYNNSWKEGIVPQKWREAVIVQERQRTLKDNQLPSHQPNQLCRQAHGTTHKQSPRMALGEEEHPYTRTGWL